MDAISLQDFLFLLPEIFLAGAGMLLLVASSGSKGTSNKTAALFCVVALGVTGFLALWVQTRVGESQTVLSEMFILDAYSLFWKILFLVATLLTLFLSIPFMDEGGYRAGEYYSLLLLATSGMMLMASGFSLLSIWISLELMALSSYILVGYFKHERRSNEAALKYFILGALSSGILLYGISLLYGATGTVQLEALAGELQRAVATGDQRLLIAVGWMLLAVGLFFKIAAVPFHIWTPDVYVGAPTPVTAYLAVASKAASFAILVRIFYQGLYPVELDWQFITAAVASVTMIWGNVAALTQSNVKRMLAYSSIGHSGYILMGVLATSEDGLWAVLFYMLAYAFITLGVFGTVVLLERREYAGETYSDYAGLARRSPFLAAVMLVFMLALTGIPPTGGFVGKFYLFAAAIESGWVWVAVIGVLTSAISLYFYLGIVVQMYLKESEESTPVPLRAPALVGAISLCVAITLLLGLFPGPFVDLAKASILPIP